MPGYRKYNKKTYRRRYPRKKVNRTKQLVTGQTQPTMLEKIANGVGAAANVAKAVLPMIMSINTEEKFKDVSSLAFNTLPFNTPRFINLNPIATGALETNRVGNSILCKNVNIRLSFTPNYTSYPTNLFRMVLFVDKQQAGTIPTATQLFQDVTTIDSAFNKNYTDRFAILKDKRWTIAQQGDQHLTVWKIFKYLNFHTRFIGSTANDADMGNNTIYLLLWSNQVTNLPIFSIYSRLNFTDN